MAVVEVRYGYTGVEYSGDESAYRMTRACTVITDDPADGQIVVAAALPAPGTAHPDAANFYSGVPQINRRGPTLWDVKIVYVTGGLVTFPQEEDPLSEPADISWDDGEYSVLYDMDIDGEEVVNSMGEPFDPPLMRDISDPVLIIERNQASFSPTTKLTYQDTICAEVFYGAAVGRAKMGKIKARSVYAAVAYWRARYEVQFRMNTPADVPDEKAWWRCILDQGVKYKDADGNVQLTPNGELVLLAADGTRIPLGDPPHWLYFREYADVSWAALGLGP